MTFNEITKKAVQEAFNHARDVDQNLVDAQQTRRVLDRLVGYQISPLLWDKVRRGLSAGRVQTVAVRLIVEREARSVHFSRSSTGRSTPCCIPSARPTRASRRDLSASMANRRASPTAKTRTAKISSSPMRCPTRSR